MRSSCFLASCQRLNAAGSEAVHTVAEMLGSGFAKVAHTLEKGVECIPVVAGQLVGVVFRYFDAATHIPDWQRQCTGPCFNHKIEEIFPAVFELAELKESVTVKPILKSFRGQVETPIPTDIAS